MFVCLPAKVEICFFRITEFALNQTGISNAVTSAPVRLSIVKADDLCVERAVYLKQLKGILGEVMSRVVGPTSGTCKCA